MSREAPPVLLTFAAHAPSVVGQFHLILRDGRFAASSG